MPDRIIGFILLTFAMATVGTTVIASKLIAGTIPPFAATAMRFAVALPILALVMLVWRQPIPKMSLQSWLLLAFQAGAGSVGYTVLLISGVSYLPAADAGVLIGTLPAASALFSVVVLRERPDLRVILAVLCATAGVLAVVWQGTGPRSLVGATLVLGAVVCESAFILFQKRMRNPLEPLAQATTMTALGLLLTVPFAAMEAPNLTISRTAYLAVLWYALVPTVGGFLLWYAGASRVKGAEAAVFTAVAPMTALLLSATFLGEVITPPQIMGLVSVGTAIVILSARRGTAQQRTVFESRIGLTSGERAAVAKTTRE